LIFFFRFGQAITNLLTNQTKLSNLAERLHTHFDECLPKGKIEWRVWDRYIYSIFLPITLSFTCQVTLIREYMSIWLVPAIPSSVCPLAH